MQRLFVALDLPQDVKQGLTQLSSGVPGARWLDAEQQHLTLRFLGEVEDSVADDIADLLAGIDAHPLTLRLSGVGHFPPRGEPRVLWAGVAQNPALFELQHQVEKALSGIPLPPPERKFQPHITLARLHDTPADWVAGFLAHHAAFISPPFTIEEFHLYSSQLTGKGAHHTKEYSYPLVEKAKLSFREKWRRGLI